LDTCCLCYSFQFLFDNLFSECNQRLFSNNQFFKKQIIPSHADKSLLYTKILLEFDEWNEKTLRNLNCVRLFKT
jgi:hypothetical protein